MCVCVGGGGGLGRGGRGATDVIFIQLCVQWMANKLFKTGILGLLQYDHVHRDIKQQFENYFDITHILTKVMYSAC